MWPPLHTTKMYNLYTTYAYNKILLKQNKQPKMYKLYTTYAYNQILIKQKTAKTKI